MPVHGTLREMVDRHRHPPAGGAGLQRRPASGGGIRGGGRRRRAGGLVPAKASPREQSMARELWFYLGEASRASAGLSAAPARCGVARHCFHPGSLIYRAAPVLARHAPIEATALTALVFGPPGSSCLGLMVLAGRVPEPPTGRRPRTGSVGPLVVRSVAASGRTDHPRLSEAATTKVTRRHDR